MKNEADIVIIGSGAAGMSAAITAGRLGLSVLVVEKSKYFGGTTAFSGGAPWIPDNHLMRKVGLEDDRASAAEYLRHNLGDRYDEKIVDTYLTAAPEMLRFMEENSEVHFKPFMLPDYQSNLPGANRCRSLLTEEYDGRKLGKHLKYLRPPRKELVLFKSMQIEGADIHLMRKAFRTPAGFRHATRLFLKFIASRLAHGRGTRLTSGNALAGRLLRSAMDSGATLWNDAAAVGLELENGVVRRVRVRRQGKDLTVTARKGVVLASGGFGANADMRAKYIPFAEHHTSLQPEENVGDGLKLGESVGGVFNSEDAGNGIWTPVSIMKNGDGSVSKYPHIFIDRAMPGSIVVAPNGKRFVNEAGSYQVFVNTMREHGLTTVYLVAGRKFLRNYGMGLVRPFPFSIKPYLRNGYLTEGKTLSELAAKLKIDPQGLEETVKQFNVHAARGQDPEFGRGADAHSRFRGDQENKPNPALGPIGDGPYYAIALHPGDLSTTGGLNTNEHAQVLDQWGSPIPGLYAAGLDMNSMMHGRYPGGGSSIGPALTFGYVAARHIAQQGTSDISEDPDLAPAITLQIPDTARAIA